MQPSNISLISLYLFLWYKWSLPDTHLCNLTQQSDHNTVNDCFKLHMVMMQFLVIIYGLATHYYFILNKMSLNVKEYLLPSLNIPYIKSVSFNLVTKPFASVRIIRQGELV